MSWNWRKNICFTPGRLSISFFTLGSTLFACSPQDSGGCPLVVRWFWSTAASTPAAVKFWLDWHLNVGHCWPSLAKGTAATYQPRNGVWATLIPGKNGPGYSHVGPPSLSNSITVHSLCKLFVYADGHSTSLQWIPYTIIIPTNQWMSIPTWWGTIWDQLLIVLRMNQDMWGLTTGFLTWWGLAWDLRKCRSKTVPPLLPLQPCVLSWSLGTICWQLKIKE